MPTNAEKIIRDIKVAEATSFAIDFFLRNVDIINRSKTRTMQAHMIPAGMYSHGLFTKVEIAYVIENKPSIAGTRTNAPKPACLICSERGHFESMSSSDPAQRIRKRYAIFFKRNGLLVKNFNVQILCNTKHVKLN